MKKGVSSAVIRQSEYEDPLNEGEEQCKGQGHLYGGGGSKAGKWRDHAGGR